MMASLKLSTILLLTTLAVFSAEVASQAEIGSHSITVGIREQNDKMIHQEHISESFLITGQKKIIERVIRASENHVITMVRAIDDATDGTGAEPSITSGGPGSDWVAVRFKSQRLRGVYFNLEVYAKPSY
ncbi:probable salivary secreted peptide [Phymastichus coffea]|uniref:probable salivary secreted peptide n=1 Tax=Phymastichus coffea TaxID=108790 RepID=UPI00273B3B9E|nr:probable salivary secreted peptide [Phymastichus coffea]